MGDGAPTRTREQLAAEAVGTARCLVVLTPAHANGDVAILQRMWREELPLGKWSRIQGGFMLVTDVGGRFSSTLPAGVAAEDVVDFLLDPAASPVTERLREVREQLLALPIAQATPEIEESIALSANALRASEDDPGRTWLARLRADTDKAGGPQAAEDVLSQFAQEVLHARRALAVDGWVTAELIIMNDLCIAVGAARSDAALVNLLESFVYADELIPALTNSLESLARAGLGEELARVAARRLDVADELIARALEERDMEHFYWLLFDAAPFAIAAKLIYDSLASRRGPEEARTSLAQHANVAEEKLVRIGQSLVNGILNFPDGGRIALHREVVSRVREEKGELAAELQAQDYLDNYLFYPHAAASFLLGKEE